MFKIFEMTDDIKLLLFEVWIDDEVGVIALDRSTGVFGRYDVRQISSLVKPTYAQHLSHACKVRSAGKLERSSDHTQSSVLAFPPYLRQLRYDRLDDEVLEQELFGCQVVH